MRDWLIKLLGGYTKDVIRTVQDQARRDYDVLNTKYCEVSFERNDLRHELAKANETILSYEHKFAELKKDVGGPIYTAKPKRGRPRKVKK